MRPSGSASSQNWWDLAAAANTGSNDQNNPVLIQTSASSVTLYQITLRPRPGGQFNLGPGRHCATVRYWRLDQPDDQRGSPPWCFTLH